MQIAGPNDDKITLAKQLIEDRIRLNASCAFSGVFWSFHSLQVSAGTRPSRTHSFYSGVWLKVMAIT